MTITRRDFLSASAAFAAAPLLGGRGWAAPLPREADIVVIGAGAAGIAAARRIQAANRKVIVLEATRPDRRALHHRHHDLRRAIRSRRALDTQSRHQPDDQIGARRGAGHRSGAAGAENPRRPPQRPRRRGRGIARHAGSRQPRHRRCLARQGRRVLRLRTAEGSGRLGGHHRIPARRQRHGQGSEGRFRDRQGPRAGSQRSAGLPPGAGHVDRKTWRRPAGFALDAGDPHQLERPRRHGGDGRRQDRRPRRHHHRLEQRADRRKHQIRAGPSQAHARCCFESQPRQLRSHRACIARQSAGSRARRCRDRAEPRMRAPRS